jgi:hypothetical protein
MDEQGTPPQQTPAQHHAAKKHESYVHKHKNTGVFIYPEEDTWAAHAKWVKMPELMIGFDPAEYQYFDGKIAEKLGIEALSDPKHADYAKYEGLRNNIAVLRNFVLTHYSRTGRFQHGSRKEIPRIEAIAENLGQALANDDALTRVLTNSTSLDVANIDGVGASEMYKYLLEHQAHPTASEHVSGHFDKFKAKFTLTTKDWHLPELEDSPFSPAMLSAPPPGFKGMELPKPDENSSTDTDNRQQDQHNKSEDEQAVELCEEAAKTANTLYSIDTLEEEPRETSIEEARKILRLLRNLEFSDQHLEEFLDHGTPATQLAKKEALVKLVDVFAQHYQQAVRKNPALKDDPILEQARDTTATIALEMAEHTRKQLVAKSIREQTDKEHQAQRDDVLSQREARLNKLIDSLASQSELRVPQSAERLMDTLEMGVQHIVGRELDTPNTERLSKASTRSHNAAMQLRDRSKMSQPVRAESLTYAQQMLEELRRIAPTDKTLLQFAQTATLQQKIEFGKQVDELSEMYRNIMAEAMEYDPTLASNPLIKDANDSMGGFSSGVKLMASKEIPNSMAAAQQISADITQEPQHWKQLHDRTIDRLIKSAEGGLEKAITAVQQAEEEQAEEKGAEQSIDGNAVMQDNLRRKRRRGTVRWSGKGFKAHLKKLLDLRADDKHLKQGAHRDDDDDSPDEGKDVAKAMAKRDQQRKAILDIQADDYALKQGRFSDDEPEIQQEGKDVLKAQAKKGEKQQLKQYLDTIADDRATGQGRFRNQDQQKATQQQRNQENQRRQQQQREQQMREQQQRGQSQASQQNMINQQIKLAKLAKLSAKDRALIEELGGSLRNMNSQLSADALQDMDATNTVKPDDRDMTQQTSDRDASRRNHPSGHSKT